MVFTNEENMVEEIEYLPPLGKSDHVTLKFIVKLYIDKPRNSDKRYNFFKGNYEQINDNLKNVNWEEILDSEASTNGIWEGLTDKLNKFYRRNIPVCRTFDRSMTLHV